MDKRRLLTKAQDGQAKTADEQHNTVDNQALCTHTYDNTGERFSINTKSDDGMEATGSVIRAVTLTSERLSVK